MSEDRLRDELRALRADEPADDADVRGRALGALQSRIDDVRSEVGDDAVATRGRGRGRERGRSGWRPGRRLTRWLAGLTAGLVVLAGAGSVAAILAQTKHTQQIPVFGHDGRLSSQFKVGAHARGYCFTSSLASDDHDAYRCMAGNAILDPCFAASARAGSVACFESPWGKVTMLVLKKRLPANTNSDDDSLPWAIVTEDHRRCVFLTGATAPMGGQRINYGCVGGSFLIGTPNRSKSLWTIRSASRYIPGDRAPISSFPIVAIAETIG